MLEKSELFLALDESQWSYATGIIGPRIVVVDPLCYERLGTNPQKGTSCYSLTSSLHPTQDAFAAGYWLARRTLV